MNEMNKNVILNPVDPLCAVDGVLIDKPYHLKSG
jgi:hypothetical protein